MTNRYMNARIAGMVHDAQAMERNGLRDIEVGLPVMAAINFEQAANQLLLVTCHCDKRTRREAMRQADRLFARAKRLLRDYRAKLELKIHAA